MLKQYFWLAECIEHWSTEGFSSKSTNSTEHTLPSYLQDRHRCYSWPALWPYLFGAACISNVTIGYWNLSEVLANHRINQSIKSSIRKAPLKQSSQWRLLWISLHKEPSLKARLELLTRSRSTWYKLQSCHCCQHSEAENEKCIAVYSRTQSCNDLYYNISQISCIRKRRLHIDSGLLHGRSSPLRCSEPVRVRPN